MFGNRIILSVIGVLALMAFKSVQAGNSRQEERVEVPIGHLFVPSEVGYEGRPFQVVLDGIMPNGCYRLAENAVSIERNGNTLTLRLYAFHQTGGVCADEDALPPSHWAPTPYTLEVDLGPLSPGIYQIAYPRPGLSDAGRSFRVEAWQGAAEEIRYADVLSVFIQDRVPAGRKIFAVVSGVVPLGSIPDIGVRREGNVLTLSPRLVESPDRFQAVEERFEQKVSLGRLEEGRYLIRVLNSKGSPLNRAFNVLMRDP